MISPPIYRGWVVLGIAILVFVLWAGVVTSWGTTILCFQQDEDFPSSSLAALGAPLTVYYAFKLSLSNFIYIAMSKIGQLGLKQVIAVGLILMALGLLLTSLANEPVSVAISFGILSGSGSGLVLICTYLVVALWFPWSHKYHVFTTSAVNTLQPIGSAILNNLSAQMCSNPSLGWRWAFRIYTVILSSLGLLLLLLYGNPPEATNEQRGSQSDKKSDFLQKPPWTLGSKIAIYVIWGVAICCKGFAFHLPFVIIKYNK
ncbi:uncharacterized protein LOC106163892 [Lingula anatina]|uniref:Uncharacterized protein LOC106163892 n=1 Tax=Lingula anatina TaxID=7574 RepID=A0A2R2MNB5_LINAN|nr:uncharacterized protein LOC106163892 [Lingula anatina]|eukprot:XP_023931695.1 uncharacterized protein LOC106163892 [Lingula anatina]